MTKALASHVCCLVVLSTIIGSEPRGISCGRLGESNAVGRPIPQAAPADTVRLAKFLQQKGYRLEMIASQWNEYLAVIAADSDSAGVVLAVRAHSGEFAFLSQVAAFREYNPSLVNWFDVGAVNTAGLILTFEVPIEGIAYSRVFTVGHEGGLTLTYEDPDLTCKPAAIRDIDGSGAPELLTYAEDPSGGDCGDECHIDLWEQLQTPPSWVTVRRWSSGEWLAAETAYPEFYGQLAQRFETAARFVQGPKGEACRRLSWVENGRIFIRWAERARTLARQR